MSASITTTASTDDEEGIPRQISLRDGFGRWNAFLRLGFALERVWDPPLQYALQQAYVRLGAISSLRNEIYRTWGTELDLSHAIYPYPDGTNVDEIADSLLAAVTAIEDDTTRLHVYCLGRSDPALTRILPGHHRWICSPRSSARRMRLGIQPPFSEPPAPAEAAPDAAQEEHYPREDIPETESEATETESEEPRR